MKRVGFVATLAGLLLIVVGVVALGMLRHVTSAPFLEKRSNAALAASTGGLYRVRLGPTSMDLGRKSFAIAGFEVSPDSAAWEERRRSGHEPRTRFSISARTLRLDGVDLASLARGRIAVAAATLESPAAEVFLNRKVPSKSTGERKPMPHELLSKLPRSVRIDTLATKNGSVRYVELAQDGTRPGVMRFENVWATVYGLVSDPEPGFEAPCRIDLRMLLAGEGATDLTLEYDLSSPRLDLKYRGRVGRMPATAFNEILVDLKGVRVNAGQHDSTWFEFDVKGDVAAGKVQVLYHGLDSEIVDKATLERGVSEKLQTFIGNAKIAEANPKESGAQATIVPVQHERPESENFFRFLWVLVREGLYATMGIA
jgi:hypothetical protein